MVNEQSSLAPESNVENMRGDDAFDERPKPRYQLVT
jgi:hypothetical protein